MEISAVSNTQNCTSGCPVKDEYCHLISAFSHKIKNQLTLISSSLQLVTKECPDISNVSLWPQIFQDLQETLFLLRDTSSFAQNESVHPTSFSAMNFLDGIFHSVLPRMIEKSICFRTSFDETIRKQTIFADEPKLREAVANLLLNAMDAIAQTDEPRNILLSASVEQSALFIHVRDNGPGIPKPYLETLFHPFVTHKANGTGLGLAITKNIAEQHGGSITVSTCTLSPDTYTDFCLKIPVAHKFL